ncbi:putative membrane-bound metal-dependent hydrolase [Escherichia coli]|nr:putative membrane-bound metal-dependent hydrolase [Escherichia coli]
MTAEGHLLFSIACAVFAKNAELTPVLAQGDWWHIVPSAILTCLLPDIDHPKSFLGQRLKWISKPIAPRFWASWFYPQSAGGICAAGNLLP